MKKLEHKGMNVTVDSAGKFRVDDREDIPAQDTYQGIRDAIDRVIKREHKPIAALKFTASRWDRSNNGIESVNVTSFTRQRYGGAQCWIKDKRGNRSKQSITDIYADSPENREIMEQIIVLDKEQTTLRKKADAETAKLVTVTPAKGDSVEHED
jgi:DNA-binding LacI/PurR family transcriptional regulator